MNFTDQLPPIQEAVRLHMNQQRLAHRSETKETKTNERNNATASSFNFEEIGCFSPLRPPNNRLEILAALYMSINTMSFWIFTFPTIFNGIALYWCLQLQANCSTIVKINPYLHNLSQLHVIYNPVIYMASSVEFRRALRRLVQKVISCMSRTLHSM